MAPDGGMRAPLWKRLLWFVALWFAGLACVGAVAWVLRRWLVG